MNTSGKLYPGGYYHIYNRGNNKENIFIEPENYQYFLHLWEKYIHPHTLTYAYCLLPNHFHFLIRIKNIQTSEVSKTSEVLTSHAFSNLFNAYAKAINKKYNRTGSLFQTRFKRKPITNPTHLVYLVFYIHYNPLKHNLIRNFRNYAYSSYNSLLSDRSTKLDREEVLDWFGGRNEYLKFHSEMLETIPSALLREFSDNDT